MREKNQDNLERAYATLQALRNNIDAITTVYGVEEKYVGQYHAALDMSEGIGIDVVQFRISSSEVRHLVAQGTTMSYPGEAAHKEYTKRNTLRRDCY